MFVAARAANFYSIEKMYFINLSSRFWIAAFMERSIKFFIL